MLVVNILDIPAVVPKCNCFVAFELVGDVLVVGKIDQNCTCNVVVAAAFAAAAAAAGVE